MTYLKLFFGISAIVLGLNLNIFHIKDSLAQYAFIKNYFAKPPDISDNESAIKVALLLDTSNSMDGLIEQAKAQLWNILNELSRTEKEGTITNLQIALYEYGNPSKSTHSNQINQLSEFTSDMDNISEKLFALTTNGGEEYCGQVILTSLNDLDWGNSDNDLKLIYIAGNESFAQGDVNYAFACKQANENNVIVNTIFCGEYENGRKQSWKAGATMTGGVYMHIDQNQQTAYVETPYDDKINKLNNKLNETYIPYGKKGKIKKDNQLSQDFNASTYSRSNVADRAAFKSSKQYKATDWDLVDAYKKDKSILKNVTAVPDSMQNISVEEMELKIKEITRKRENIQKEMQELDVKRRTFKKEQSKQNPENILEKNVIESIKKQAREKGFEVKG